jgi:hypothetical protein
VSGQRPEHPSTRRTTAGGWHRERERVGGAASDAEASEQLSRVSSVRGDDRKQGRLGVAAGGGPFGRRAAIIVEFEQGKLTGLGGIPCLKLLAAQFANLLPPIGMAANEDDIGLRHGDAHAASAWVDADVCKLCR